MVVLGYGQPETDVDGAFCVGRGIPVFRRPTGGTGIVHRRDLALSLVLPADHPWAASVRSAYDGLVEAIAGVLRRLGHPVERPPAAPVRSCRERSPVCFEDVLSETLTFGGRKVLGCAQARRRGGVLVHAHLHLDPDPALYAAVFRVPREGVAAAVGGLGGGLERATLAEALTGGIAAAVAGWENGSSRVVEP